MRRHLLIDSLESRRLLAAGFQIQLSFESSVSTSVRSVIQQAANRWQQVITGDIPDVAAGAWGAAVDDIRITARVKSIDGAGNGVAQARPLYIRTGTNKLPIAGEIEIDSADIASQTAAGTLQTIVTHEIAHALGFGTIWSQYAGLTTGLGGSNPLYLGANALREYRTVSGQTAATGVPLENTGSTGTRDSHWRESTFKTEIMTGFITAGLNPLSRVTLGQFQDLGYSVNYAAADAFSLVAGTGTVTGLIFNDQNRNGIKDTNESGLPGASVYADRNFNGLLDSGEPTASANSSGVYTLGGLAAGTYDIRAIIPTGTIITAPSGGKHFVTVTSGGTVGGRDFGIASLTTPAAGSISGTVFADANRNGRQDAGEAGLAGYVIYLDTNFNNVRDSNEKFATSASNGTYTLTNVAGGGYNVTIVKNGATVVAPSSGAWWVTLASGGSSTGRNFAIASGTTPPPPTGAGTISGTVFNDTNRNGRLDAGEAGRSGFVIFLDTNYNGVRDASEKFTTSASNGTYTLTNIAGGGYNVTIVKNGATVVTPSSGAWWVTLASGGSSTGRNFAIAPGTGSGGGGATLPPASGGTISGTVFRDGNRNGRLDAGEAGLANYVIFLDTNYNGVRDASEKFATSASNGTYALTGVAAGGYNVTIVLGGSTIISPSSRFWWTTLASGANVSGRNFAIA